MAAARRGACSRDFLPRETASRNVRVRLEDLAGLRPDGHVPKLPTVRRIVHRRMVSPDWTIHVVNVTHPQPRGF
jgi:hypothetical protein